MKKPVSVRVVDDYLRTAFDEETAVGIFDSFVTGGDLSAFGVAQALTAYSQTDEVDNVFAQVLDDSALDHAKALV